MSVLKVVFTMEKNNLSEIKFSDESISYELKKNSKQQVISNNELIYRNNT